MAFCHQCGAELEPGDRFCAQCGTPVRDSAEAPPQPSPSPPPPPPATPQPQARPGPAPDAEAATPSSSSAITPEQLRKLRNQKTVFSPAPEATGGYCGVGIRFAAQIIDAVPILIVYFVLGRLVAALFGGVTDDGFNLQGGPAILVMFLVTVFWLAYFTLLEALWGGQTLGKKLVKIRVLREDGHSMELSESVVRNLLRVVDGFFCYLVGAILVWNSPKKQRLGDRVAKTVVVKVVR